MLGPAGLKKKKERKEPEVVGNSFADLCVYEIVVGWVVYTGIEL